jgi:hypothetical protein
LRARPHADSIQGQIGSVSDSGGVLLWLTATGVFMVVAMWIFPEAGVKKGDIKRS